MSKILHLQMVSNLVIYMSKILFCDKGIRGSKNRLQEVLCQVRLRNEADPLPHNHGQHTI